VTLDDVLRSKAEMDLARFEALVLSQQPASEPWKPVTPYDFESRKAIEGKHPELIKEVFQPALVIDAGCGPDAILVRLLQEQGVTALGFDPQLPKPSINPALIRGSLLEQWFEDWRCADLVICREVLEHLTVLQIRQAVMNLCALSSKFVYATTRYHPNPQSLLDVATSDELDPTHCSMLNQDLLRVLFVLEGFKRRADLEQKMDWQQKGRVLVYERAS